jgi:hypothetical protein
MKLMFRAMHDCLSTDTDQLAQFQFKKLQGYAIKKKHLDRF